MIKVLIAEDMPALLKKYQRLLEKDGELEVVGRRSERAMRR